MSRACLRRSPLSSGFVSADCLTFAPTSRRQLLLREVVGIGTLKIEADTRIFVAQHTLPSMAWEQRKTSKNSYYYRSSRLPDGRVFKTYYGKGIAAANAAEADRLKRAEREQQLNC